MGSNKSPSEFKLYIDDIQNSPASQWIYDPKQVKNENAAGMIPIILQAIVLILRANGDITLNPEDPPVLQSCLYKQRMRRLLLLVPIP